MSTFLFAARKMGMWYGLVVAAALLLIPVVASATTIGNSITVTNDATISGNVTTTNATSSGYMDVGGKLANSNRSYTNGDLNVGNQLAVDGATFVSSTMDVTGNSRFYGTLIVDGAINASSTFQATGASRLYSTLIVDTSVSTTMVTTSRHLSVGTKTSSLSARWTSGDVNITGQLLVEGNAFVSNTLQVTNDIFTYGGASSTMVTSSRHLGVGSIASLSARWSNGDVNIGGQILVDGNAFVSSALRVTGQLIAYDSVTSTMVTSSRHLGVGSPVSLSARWTNGDANIGGQILVDGNAFVSSALHVTGVVTLYNGVSTTGGIYPRTNNTIDLGGVGAAWRDVFVSNTLTIGTVSTTASSTAILGVLSTMSAGIDFPDVATSTGTRCANSSNTAGGDVTVTGTAMGDIVSVAPTIWDDAFTSGTLSAFVTAMNQVRIMYCGTSGDSTAQDRDPVTQRYRVTVWKF